MVSSTDVSPTVARARIACRRRWLSSRSGRLRRRSRQVAGEPPVPPPHFATPDMACLMPLRRWNCCVSDLRRLMRDERGLAGSSFLKLTPGIGLMAARELPRPCWLAATVMASATVMNTEARRRFIMTATLSARAALLRNSRHAALIRRKGLAVGLTRGFQKGGRGRQRRRARERGNAASSLSRLNGHVSSPYSSLCPSRGSHPSSSPIRRTDGAANDSGGGMPGERRRTEDGPWAAVSTAACVETCTRPLEIDWTWLVKQTPRRRSGRPSPFGRTTTDEREIAVRSKHWPGRPAAGRQGMPLVAVSS